MNSSPKYITYEYLKATKWCRDSVEAKDGKYRLFLFPYGGGCAKNFSHFAPTFPFVEMCPVELPGHGSRLAEEPYKDMQILSDEFIATIFPPDRPSDKPFCFLGISLGATMAISIARGLKERGLKQPAHIFVISSNAPEDVHFKDNPFNPATIERCLNFLGVDQALLESDPEFKLLTHKMHIADICMQKRFVDTRTQVDCNITAWWPSLDRRVTKENMEKWKDYTTEHFKFITVPNMPHLFATEKEHFLKVSQQMAQEFGLVITRRNNHFFHRK